MLLRVCRGLQQHARSLVRQQARAQQSQPRSAVAAAASSSAAAARMQAPAAPAPAPPAPAPPRMRAASRSKKAAAPAPALAAPPPAAASSSSSDDEDAAPPTPAPPAAPAGRGRRSRSHAGSGSPRDAAAAAAHSGAAAAAAAGAAPPATGAAGDDSAAAAAAAKPKRERAPRKPAAAAADAADASAPATCADSDAAAAAKPKRKRAPGKAAAAAADAVDGGAPAPKKRRMTKKTIAEDVRSAAAQGQFGELVHLASSYSHVALYASSSNSDAWAGLEGSGAVAAGAAAPAPPAAAAGGGGIGSGNGAGSSAGPQLCRASALGSYRQQVWLHQLAAPPPQQQQGAAAAPTTPAPRPGSSRSRRRSSPSGGDGGAEQEADPADPPPSQPEQQQQQQQQQQQAAPAPAPAPGSREVALLPNLGYACLCSTMRQYGVFNSRDCVKKTRYGPDGLAHVSRLALENAHDLVPVLLWNEAHGIRFFRLSSCILPWMSSYRPEELPDWPAIQQALAAAGALATRLGHRLTFHPSEFVKIAGERPEWVTQSVAELEVHSRIFDEMGFLPATPFNKINIHVGGSYGGRKEETLRRFAQVVNERLSANCRARLTVENDDRASLYSVADLQLVHQLTGIPIVCDLHHWKFCPGGQSQEAALRAAIATWPAGVRPVVHWSESPELPGKKRNAHSDFVDGPINLYGLEGEVDVVIESKKELSLLAYREAVLQGWQQRPRARNWRGDGEPALDTPHPRLDAATSSSSSEGEEEEEADDGDESGSEQ